ncbi:MAG: hypothetical protein HYU57_06470 [Micavibrio aeruginosavorus]|nr:hypothetical protein [Micavibrio aeruginosavorus]
MSKTPPFHIDWLRFIDSEEAQVDWLRQEIAVQDALAERAGVLTRQFNAAVRGTGVGEKIHLGVKGAAFFPVGGSVPRNTILYGSSVLVSRQEFMNARLHEQTHALQFNRIAAASARFPGPGAEVCLCPRDSYWLSILMERDAYLRAALLEDMIGRKPGKPQTAESFQGMARRLERRMAPFMWVVTASAYYPDYRAMWTYHLAQKDSEGRPPRPEYVRLEEEDLQELVTAAGPAAMRAERLIRPRSLGWWQKDGPIVLNALAGIDDDRALPGFGEALRARGLSREEFLARTRPATGSAPG